MSLAEPDPIDPQDISVRYSDRAKHVRLRVKADGSVELVLPRGADRVAAAAFLERKRHWLELTRARVCDRQKARERARRMLPATLNLQALGETWCLHQDPSAARNPRLVQMDGSGLLVAGLLEDPLAWRPLLIQWLRQRAACALPPWLERVARASGFSFSGVQIRAQRTRWGSCSSRKRISLNLKLLFVPPELVHYLFIHELCHTVYMNHSAAFWALVRSHLADYRDLDRRLRRATSLLPEWL